jgi:hypothetical protein
MFDSKPNSSATGAVAALAPTQRNQGERRTILYIEDMYNPDIHDVSEKDNYVVPFENQLILDVDRGYWYRCAKVDYEGTLKATLVPWQNNNPNDENVLEQDWVFGIKGGPMLGEALLAVDFSVRPNVARVDATIMRPGAAYALLYKGNTPGDEGKIISAVYDQGGVMQTNKIPTPLAEIVDRTNLEIKTTGQFSVTENEESLVNGTQCFLAFFDQGGNFIPPGQLVRVQHSAYMKDHRVGIKYVTEIRLLAPWFSNSNQPGKIIVPINVNLLALELRAEVLYSDGTTSGPMPVNGEKFVLEGLQEHRPTFPGQTNEVVLIYKLSPNEQFYEARPGSPLFERRTYSLEAGNVDGAYAPRLYTYPQWDTAINGYRLQHFLYDLDRKTFIDVSDKVTMNDQSPAWRPSSYGVAQSLIFNINLRDVAPTYVSATFVQYTEIVLYRDLNTAGKKFDVSFVFDKPTYQALNLKATNNGASSKANVTNGFTKQVDWLNALFWGVYPSYDTWNEEKAPSPTHFYLMHEDGRKWLYPLADWNKDLPITISMQPGKTWYIVWVNRDGSGKELQLASTGVIVTV